MSRMFQELDWQSTSEGEISLRRRHDPQLRVDVFEVKLGEEFLMSSLFTAAEQALADLALARLPGHGLAVAVGGLGLGYTAAAALTEDRVGELVVVDALAPVIDWHRRGLVPLGERLAGDPRCRLVQGDFFALARGPGFDPESPGRRFDALLVDIDHSPRHLLAQTHADYYAAEGTARLLQHLHPGGVYALWSNDPPDPEHLAVLREVFTDVVAEVVEFPNPLQGGTSTNTVYLATAPEVIA